MSKHVYVSYSTQDTVAAEQERDEGCRQELADLYAWFTESFLTEDPRMLRVVPVERT